MINRNLTKIHLPLGILIMEVLESLQPYCECCAMPWEISKKYIFLIIIFITIVPQNITIKFWSHIVFFSSWTFWQSIHGFQHFRLNSYRYLKFLQRLFCITLMTTLSIIINPHIVYMSHKKDKDHWTICNCYADDSQYEQNNKRRLSEAGTDFCTPWLWRQPFSATGDASH